MTIEEVFMIAVGKPPADRDAYLAAACAADAALRAQVEGLVRAHEEAGGALEQPLFRTAPTIDHPSAGDEPGRVLDRYKLIEQIGEGGMGSVWMAQQTAPVKRLVAVKLIKAGMDSRSVLARFEAERQALALMDHPNIARVLDAGTADTGRPYFVMELVKGVPITRYCDEHHLTPRQRLELFVPVCQAIQHAHQKGVIHRDLKPSNVLVAQYDGRPVPKVIDFGVAKAAGQPLTEKTLVTGFGAIVGTPEYMSPEQAEVNQLDIDTRSDIYSLGVLLYELLAGSPPFSRKELQGAGVLEMLRVIREREPSRPSTKLSTAEGLPTLAANRGTEPSKLTKLLRGELDWIVMKALEKDRSRRYDSANGFAADAQRYLAGEAVLAVPPSVAYRFRKFARRNKRVLVTAAVICAAVLVAAGSFGWVVRDREAGRVRTTTEVNQFLDRAEELYADNRLPEAAAEVQKARGVLEAGRGDGRLDRQVRQWLADLDTAAKLEEIRLATFDGEGREQGYADYARVFREYGIDVEALPIEEATARVAGSQIRADLVLALLNWGAGIRSGSVSQDPVRWQRMFEIARGAEADPWRLRYDAAHEAKDLGTLRELADRVDLGRVRTRLLASLGSSLNTAGDTQAAVAFLRRAQRQHPGDYLINSNLASCLAQLKPPPLDEVIAFRRAALAARPRSAAAHLNLGVALARKERLDEAITEYREAIHLRPGWGLAHSNLGLALQRQTNLDEAITCHRTAIGLEPKNARFHANLGRALRERRCPDEAVVSLRTALSIDPKYVFAHHNLGLCFQAQHNFDRAIGSFRTAVDIDPSYVPSYLNIATVLYAQKKPDEAVVWCQKALAIDPNDKFAHNVLGNALCEQKNFDGAIACYRTALAIDPNYTTALINLGNALGKQNKPGEEIDCYTKALAIDPRSTRGYLNLGNARKSQNRYEEAMDCYKKAIAIDPYYADAHYAIGNLFRKQRKPGDAIDWYEKAVAIDPYLAEAFYGLGLSHFDQKHLAEAAAAHREAIRLRPDYVNAYNGLGKALNAQNKLGEAIDCFQKAVAHDPHFASAYSNLGLTLERQNRWDEAICCYQRAVGLDPNDSDYSYNLANALWKQNRLDEAIDWGKQAVAIDPKDARGYNVVAIALKKQNKLAEAICCYQRAVALDPKNADYHHNLGLAFAAQNNLDAAIAEYREAAALDTQDVGSRYNLGNALSKKNKLDDAIVAYQETTRLKPDHVFAHNNLGDVLMRRGKVDDAVASFREAIRLKPDHAPAHFNLGLALIRKGQVDDAIAAYREAVRHKPDLVEVYYSLGHAFSRKGNLDDAITAYATAVCWKPDHADAHINLGVVLTDAGRYDDAIAALREGVRLKPSDPLAHNNLGWVLAATGHVEGAIAAYEQAIRLKNDYTQPQGNLAWLLAAGPDPRFWDGKRAVELMNKVELLGGKNALSRRITGLAHYRAGNWKESIAALEEAMALSKGGNGFHWFWVAMAHQRLNNTAAAREWYGKAVGWMERAKPADGDGELHRVRAEAAKLLGLAAEEAPRPREK